MSRPYHAAVIVFLLSFPTILPGCVGRWTTGSETLGFVDSSGNIGIMFASDENQVRRLQDSIATHFPFDRHLVVSLSGESILAFMDASSDATSPTSGVWIWPACSSPDRVIEIKSGLWGTFVSDQCAWVHEASKQVLVSWDAQLRETILPVEARLKRLYVLGSDEWLGLDPDGHVWHGSLSSGIRLDRAQQVHVEGHVVELVPCVQRNLCAVSIENKGVTVVRVPTGESLGSTGGQLAWPYYSGIVVVLGHDLDLRVLKVDADGRIVQEINQGQYEGPMPLPSVLLEANEYRGLVWPPFASGLCGRRVGDGKESPGSAYLCKVTFRDQ